MEKFLLSEAETLLVRAIEGGAVYNAGEDPPLRAEALARLLRGIPVILTDEEQSRPLRILPCGLRVFGAKITGSLMLDDAAAQDGGPLPSISFENCEFSEAISR